MAGPPSALARFQRGSQSGGYQNCERAWNLQNKLGSEPSACSLWEWFSWFLLSVWARACLFFLTVARMRWLVGGDLFSCGCGAGQHASSCRAVQLPKGSWSVGWLETVCAAFNWDDPSGTQVKSEHLLKHLQIWKCGCPGCGWSDGRFWRCMWLFQVCLLLASKPKHKKKKKQKWLWLLNIQFLCQYRC